VNEAEWSRFVDNEIVSRFPKGLTVVNAAGEWRDEATNRIVREPSKVVQIVLPGQVEDIARLNEIVAAYKRRFKQHSVIMNRAAGLRVVLAARPSPPLPGALPRLRYSKVLPNYPGSIENVGARERAMEPVKFVALDRDDLEVVSTHLQDALVKVCDVIWRPQEKRVVVGLSRFDWLSAEGTKPELRRCRSALRFERVNCCKWPKRRPGRKSRSAQSARGRICRDRSARWCRQSHFSRAGERCGSRSNAWRPSSPISDPLGRRPRVPIHTDETPDLRG